VIASLVKTMRPRQWAKNIFVFAALTFDVKLFNIDVMLIAAGVPLVEAVILWGLSVVITMYVLPAVH
jgi:hypothetical protein